MFFSQIVIKLLGFVYRVIITGMDGFGDIGNSYYGAAFQFYTAILAVSTVGIPSAVAKLVSEKVALKDYKGAHKILKETNFPNFKGNIEARNALSGEADVIVCDGFTGNVFLKTTEGTAKFFSGMIKKAFKRSLWAKLGYLHVRKGMKDLKETFDYNSTGGAMLLGINGVVVKAHGNSDAYSFGCALNVAKKLVENKIVDKIKEGILEDEKL